MYHNRLPYDFFHRYYGFLSKLMRDVFGDVNIEILDYEPRANPQVSRIKLIALSEKQVKEKLRGQGCLRFARRVTDGCIVEFTGHRLFPIEAVRQANYEAYLRQLNEIERWFYDQLIDATINTEEFDQKLEDNQDQVALYTKLARTNIVAAADPPIPLEIKDYSSIELQDDETLKQMLIDWINLFPNLLAKAIDAEGHPKYAGNMLLQTSNHGKTYFFVQADAVCSSAENSEIAIPYFADKEKGILGNAALSKAHYFVHIYQDGLICIMKRLALFRWMQSQLDRFAYVDSPGDTAIRRQYLIPRDALSELQSYASFSLLQAKKLIPEKTEFLAYLRRSWKPQKRYH